MIIFFFIVIGIYLLTIVSLMIGFQKVKETKIQNKSYNTVFSIIIPFRNEAIHLKNLTDSIQKLAYDKNKFECIFVNDDSSDNSVKIINKNLSKSSINYTIINNSRKSNSPKKDAINNAINIAKFDWITTTDADCKLPKLWLQAFDSFIQHNESTMIVGPVMYETSDFTFLENFQILDFLSLQGATVGGFGINNPFLCNGANLAYLKNSFIELKGFEGNDTIASGDDIFLFEKFYKNNSKKVHFLKSKEAVVYTKAVESWNQLTQQRMRWAAKSSRYHLLFGKLVGMIVLTTNLVFITSLIVMFRDQQNALNYLYGLVLKIAIDFALIKQTSIFYRGSSTRVKNYEIGSLIYPFFGVFVVLKTFTGKYKWKGREFKK